MSIFGGLSRVFTSKPPKIPAGSTVLLEDGLDPAIGEPTPTFRPYYVTLDADHQEVGDRHYLKPTIEAFSDLGYAEAWSAWVNARGALPEPPYPTSDLGRYHREKSGYHARPFVGGIV